ncbi:hypothetical protein LIER_41067 [Lithospermum erythrorhizon]|uniref:Reverse transcriptase domain-containing protein n=1 Tax=Lithospermum erythrorhizon TaxID=34254 RepID=A0AAV3R3L6_LITER
MSDLLPISLCNIVSNIIGKVMTTRLRPMLMNIISENQSGFLPGRTISNNILTTHVVLHFTNDSKSVKNTNIAIKLDMSKTYVRVEWNFLENIMLELSFCR